MGEQREAGTPAERTARAAQSFTRRTLLQSATVGAAAAAGPWYVRDALSSSGALSILNWADELPDPVIPNFERVTGIKVTATPFSRNEEQIGTLRATKGEGFDLCQPTRDRAPQFKELGVLAPFDANRLNLDALLPAVLDGSTSVWTWDGKLHHLPHCWGSEAIGWRTDHAELDCETLSFGTLWGERYRGEVQGRPHSLLLGIGLWMDATGRVRSNRMLDTYRDEDSMRKAYDPILAFAVAHKAWLRQAWDSADDIRSGFLEGGCTVGQIWDGPVLALGKAGKPVSCMAPREGAIAWIDGWALSGAAENVAQAYEWLNYLHTPEVSAMVAENSGYNPVVKGSDRLLSEAARKTFEDTYPDDAVSRLWNRPPEPSWFAVLRNQYAETFRAA